VFLHQQGLDTSTPGRKAMFQMFGVFAELERAIIVARVNAGVARARRKSTRTGRAIGRPIAAPDKVKAAQRALADGMTVRAAAAAAGLSVGKEGRLRQGMVA
jgi:DNA invertase Pin-like site-specific DNA recombinase